MNVAPQRILLSKIDEYVFSELGNNIIARYLSIQKDGNKQVL